MPEIITLTPDQAPAVRRMIYTIAHYTFDLGGTLEEDLAYCQQNWALADLNDIQHSYFENGGTFLAVMDGDHLAGTGAVRRMQPGVCELKRFWFLPQYHGTGQAPALLERLLAFARAMGYHTMRLETSRQHQTRAAAFYRKHGFYEIPRYSDDPDALGMEKLLAETPQTR
jgi:putative acetyltransferase